MKVAASLVLLVCLMVVVDAVKPAAKPTRRAVEHEHNDHTIKRQHVEHVHDEHTIAKEKKPHERARRQVLADELEAEDLEEAELEELEREELYARYGPELY